MNTATIPASLQSIPIALIDPSPTQPRKSFTKIEEMAEDIRLHGILQPVLLRPLPKKRYELVFGERRLRGAKLAELKEVPAMVRELTDAEVVEIQIVENAKRSDIHPLEEAEAYETLHKKHGYTVEEIAAKVGKSSGTIYARLKFVTLIPEARKAFLEGTLTAATALLLVRIPHVDLQKQALKVLTQKDWHGEVPSAKSAADIIEREFMMRLEEANFDTKDAALVDGVPGCNTCPKRTGNQRDLFGEASRKDLCTDPKCFKAKNDATWNRKAEDAKKRSLPVLEGKKAQEALSYTSSYVDLDKKNYDDKQQRTYRECLAKKKADLPVVLARDVDGAAHELVNKKDLAKAGVVSNASAKPVDDIAKKQREAAKKKREKVSSISEQLVAKAGKLRGRAFELAFTRAIAAGVSRLVWHETAKGICARRGLDLGKPNDPHRTLGERTSSMTVEECRELVVEVLASDETSRKTLCALFKVSA